MTRRQKLRRANYQAGDVDLGECVHSILELLGELVEATPLEEGDPCARCNGVFSLENSKGYLRCQGCGLPPGSLL